ncbi:hypothetical protein MOO02_17165 [Escherichia coli]|nr:hypothetical protein [Escherichia coli]MCJ8493751.1 hypothetical protein [Escherichia coli]MCN4414672.1 hypothetical protein [Escherichia coli]
MAFSHTANRLAEMQRGGIFC